MVWVFSYGSLMTDPWEKDYDCIQRVVATLYGYRRTFNKASVVNWGSNAYPCPTLNLYSDANSSCTGIAFEFPEIRKNDIENYLKKREGKNFIFSELEVFVEGTSSIRAIVPLYDGKNLLPIATDEKFIEKIRQAHGTSGSCTDYIIDIYNQLEKIGITDSEVSKVRNILYENKKF